MGVARVCASCRYNLEVLGLGGSWTGVGTKLDRLLHRLRNPDIAANDVVLYLDAFDTVGVCRHRGHGARACLFLRLNDAVAFCCVAAPGDPAPAQRPPGQVPTAEQARRVWRRVCVHTCHVFGGAASC